MSQLSTDQIDLLRRLDGVRNPRFDNWYPRADIFHGAKAYGVETLNALVAEGYAEEKWKAVRITAKGCEILAAAQS